MDSRKLKNTIIPVLIIVLGFAVIFPLSAFMEKTRPELPPGFEDSDLALQGSRLKGYSLGFEGLIADIYWMQSLQYIGNKVLKSKKKIDIDNLQSLNPRLLYPYLDTATTLDPHFIQAYSYGAVILPAIDKQKAIDIAKKGIANNPNEWKLYQHLGYIYWRLGDFEKAGEVYSEGAKIQSAPPFMKMISARMKTQGENRETAQKIYREMFDQTDDKQIKDFAKSRIFSLRAMDEIDAINSVLAKFQQEKGKCVNNLREIFPNLQKIKLPSGEDFQIDKSRNLVDPGGTPYLLKKEECKIEIDAGNTKLPLK